MTVARRFLQRADTLLFRCLRAPAAGWPADARIRNGRLARLCSDEVNIVRVGLVRGARDAALQPRRWRQGAPMATRRWARSGASGGARGGASGAQTMHAGATP
jgi:hypothetical protein